MAKVQPESRLHGFLVIDKPATWTSHDVIGYTRRLIGERQIGHAGTLDPAATGVLPLGVGYATRLMEYLAETDKAYVATIRFGIETDSYDGDGRVVSTGETSGLDLATVEPALEAWQGDHLQRPPMHSAVRVAGKRLYEHARRGEEIERESRPVTFHRLELLDWRSPDARVFVECSKGTYIRSLAHDLGEALGTGAHLANLVRTRSGPFCLDQAWTLAELKATWEAGEAHRWADISWHPDTVIASWPALVLTAAEAIKWRNGQMVSDEGVAARQCRAYGSDGDWLGIGVGSLSDRGWRPTKVIGSAR